MGQTQKAEAMSESHPEMARDRIDKEVVLKAPRSRVWKAISDSKEFGSWFGIAFSEPFVAGKAAIGHLTEPSKYAGMRFEFVVDQVAPEKLFSFRWHPAALDPKVDYSQEPMTLVTFALEDAPGGTKLMVSETGFSALPRHRIADALRMNDGGWTEQVRRIGIYVGQNS